MSQMIESFMNDAAEAQRRAQPLAFEDLSEGAAAGAPLLASPHPLHGVKIRLEVCVGAAGMTLGELIAARQNEVLTLDRRVEQPVDLLLEGRVVARGQLVAVDGAFAVRITELPLPLKF
ncbi:flagellar motor switch protein [Ramlibacter terrae]|uniref:Flagellar motor switch protein FliN n=1 Tax=Ramlibacter terrae TaxID=2732511 RepID=A0ABX6P610_9BURK|nr:flagellar motor switch protein [Ramlibacter terrae]